MAEFTVKIKYLHQQLGKTIPAPQRMSEHAAGFDVAAALDAPITIKQGERFLVPCGFSMAIAPGYEAQMRPRSGLAIKNGVTLLNSPGTIDSDYRGEVKAIVVNHGHKPFTVEPGQRIAQMVFARIHAPELQVVFELDDTKRGDGGFGSTKV